MQSGWFKYRHSRVHYYSLGTGQQPLICFHGYGERAETFAFLEKYAGQQYRIFAVDLPYHGDTDWGDGLAINVEAISDIVNGILSDHGFTVDKSIVTLMGFSLGGRVCLSLYQLMPEKIKKVVLLAPDGLRVNGWYWLATQTWLGNRLFRFTMKHPSWFFGLLQVFNKLQLVNASVFKFVRHYIGDAQYREMLYKRWTSLRKLKPDLSLIKKEIRKYDTPVRLLYGKHDRIILPVRGEAFRKGIEDNCKLEVIASGHQLLQEKYITEIMTALQV